MKKFLLSCAALLCGTAAWAGVTDLPEVSTAENPVYYVIHNTRSTSGGLIYFDANTVKDNNPVALDDKYLFYFTDAGDGKVKICNKATNLKLASNNSWTADGADCVIGVTPHSSKAGLFIQFGTSDQDCLNEQNFGDGYTKWSANDEGSIFVLDKVEEAHMPVVGKTYNVANPIFIGNQGVIKGMTVADADATGATWKTVLYSTENDQWVYNVNSEGTKMSLKNVATSKYLNGTSLSDTEVFGDLKYLGCGQFNIIVNGTTCHAAGHSGGAGSNGSIVTWGGGLGSASAWTLREATEAGYIGAYADFFAPVDITTDDANPKYFSIKSGRGDAQWYTYTPSDQKIALEAYEESDAQLWYFKGAVDANGNVLVRLFSKASDGKAMSYPNSNNGSEVIVAQALDTEGYYNTWKLQKGSSSVHFRLQTSDGANYLSQNGGGTAKMGLWSGSSTTDTGTQMYIYTPETMYLELADEIATAEAKTASTACGYFTPSEAYTTALSSAKALTETSTVLASFNAKTTLKATYSGLTQIMPVASKFYRIKNNAGNAVLTCGTSGRAQMVAADDGKDNIFYLTDDNQLVSYSNGLYFALNADNMLAYKSEVGVTDTVSFVFVSTPNVGLGIRFKKNVNNRYMYSDNTGDVNAGNNPALNGGYLFTLEEVTWLPVPMNTEAGYATLYSPVSLDYTYANEERVKAYTATAVSADNTQITLTECENGIPANTPVILKYVEGGAVENGCVYLHVSTNEIAAPAGENKLQGTFAAANIAEDAYVLSKPVGKEVGLYKAQKTTTWKNNGFKAYLPASALNPVGGEAPALMFNFGGETDAIENIQTTENAGKAVIYDLSGRRVKNAQKGIFIINGKKVIK